MYKGKKVSVIIAAAGSARRMRGVDKIFMKLGDRPVLAHVLSHFAENPAVDEIVLAVREDQIARCRGEIAESYGAGKVAGIVPGGNERPDTVRNALQALSPDTELILVQDGARPFSDAAVTERVLEAACRSGAAVPAVPVKDTIKMVSIGKDGETVVATPERSRLRAVQTPQGFDADLLRNAYDLSAATDDEEREAMASVTDDASLAEQLGRNVLVVEGSEDNIKITTTEDIEKAEMILRRRKTTGHQPTPESAKGEAAVNGEEYGFPRTGIGFDVHAFAEDRKLILGGVEIPYEKGLAGHSDADVLVHALMDALLGACGLRDIGYYFPDSDPAYKGANSMALLARVVEMLREHSHRVINVDIVVMAQEPKLSPHIEQMKKNIADVLGVPEAFVGVKATTTERLGFTGRKEGIAAQAVATVTGRGSQAQQM